MYPQKNPKLPLLKPLVFLLIAIATAKPIFGHQVQITQDVGATLHIEPNDNPSAGESAQAWFNLTRKGGKLIPLTQCDCQLTIYAKPYIADEPPLLTPPLKPVVVNNIKDVPGAEIIFPRPGLYELQFTGKPTNGKEFKPFQLSFEVVVAQGKSNINTSQDTLTIENKKNNSQIDYPLITTVIITVLTGAAIVVFFLLRLQKR